MYLVKHRRMGMDKYVFVKDDPRSESSGFSGDVIADVTLDYDMNAIHKWPDHQPRPDPQLGRDPGNPKHYKVFKFGSDLVNEKYERVQSGTPIIVFSWSDYRKQYYPVPDEYAAKMTQDEWFDFLEEADFAAKIRRRMTEIPEPKAGSPRDQIAEWVAKRHMAADGGIQKVWYLPAGSPSNEIRLIEIGERYSVGSDKIEPVDFGLDVSGDKFQLFVADVTGDQLQKIKADPSKLPRGWKFDAAMSWGRRK